LLLFDTVALHLLLQQDQKIHFITYMYNKR